MWRVVGQNRAVSLLQHSLEAGTLAHAYLLIGPAHVGKMTLALNLAGICGLSLPCGFDGAGLPIGLQVMGPPLGEETILRLAHAYEQAAGWHERRPKL